MTFFLRLVVFGIFFACITYLYITTPEQTKWTAITLLALVSYHLGWLVAHHVVADECEKLGGFYVNDKVFKCTNARSCRSKPERSD